MSPRFTLACLLVACSHPHDVTAVYAPVTPGAGAIDVVLNSPSGSLTVTVGEQLVIDRKFSRHAHIDGVPAGPTRVRVATGGNCERGSVTDHDVIVPAGGTATVALAGPEPNTGCAIFTGLYYVGMNVGLAAIAIAAIADARTPHVTHVK